MKEAKLNSNLIMKNWSSQTDSHQQELQGRVHLAEKICCIIRCDSSLDESSSQGYAT